MAKNYVRENVPLSRFGVLVAQLESIVASSSQQSPDPFLCFDLLSDLISAIDEEPKESILLWQRKCEDALFSLLVLGAKRPVRHLASVAMASIIYKGDAISIYSRVGALQGFLSDGKKNEPQKVAGVAQCLGELYRYFGRRITSGLLETTTIATKLMKFNEEFVRQESLFMLQKALEGCGGSAVSAAYTEAFRLITRFAAGDKSFIVRIAAARCLKAFANIGGPGLGVGELESSASSCVKALEDPVSSVRDAFAEALGSLLALGMNPEAQVQPRGKGPYPQAKKLEGCLQRHLALPFTKASGSRLKDTRMCITLSWVSFLQTIRLKYLHPDSELQNYALQVMEMLYGDTSIDAHALACILYILRVGITDQMTEPTQRVFLIFLGNQLESADASPSMKIAALRTLSYTLKTLGEVPTEFKEVIDNTVVAAISHSSELVRIEAALTLRVLAEVDPTCVGGLISYGVTTLSALRENISFEKGSNLKIELDSFHGQATVLAALVFVSPKLPLGYPARLPRSVLEVSKKMLTESSRNPMAATVEKEAGWLLLSSLLYAMPKEELEDQVFDILSLWAPIFGGIPEQEIKQIGDSALRVGVWSSAVDALAAFIRCFISPNSANNGILLQPVMVYLNSALSYILLLQSKELSNFKPAINILIIRTLMAYQSLPDPMAYKSDHPRIIQLCTIPYRDASKCEQSTCLRLLLDKRDAWLGPYVPGRDWFEDEFRAFQGGKDGLMPCPWENGPSSFPQPETINNTLVNQMLLCFGILFASQDSGGMLLLLEMIEQCLKSGKKQIWHAASVTNICVGLLVGLKALITSRRQPLGSEILNPAQSIFQSILAEGDICASQRRASSEGLGLLARLGNDAFTARLTRSLLGDLIAATDSYYAGSIAFALGCIHRSAGGMALSSLVPLTVSSISSLAKSTISGLQIWSLHGLLLTIEAAGFSFVSHVQATLGLAMDILLSEDNGFVDLQQGVARLINAIVAVLGPELASGSIFFSRCKSVIAEIRSLQETTTLLESVRFTQQLVLFAPQAVSVHSHVQTLLSTLSSRQPTLRHLAVSTLRHLIEKDPVSIIDEKIEDNLFRMLDDETDSEIGNLVRATIMRLLLASCPSRPSHWILLCRKMVLAVSARQDVEANSDRGGDRLNGPDSDSRLNFGEDDENMVSGSKAIPVQGHIYEASNIHPSRHKHLRYRTRVFAAECLSHLPTAVGSNPAHFDLTLARKNLSRENSGDWLVLHVQELISLAYQISTIQFENMRPIGVGLLNTIVDKFEKIPDPELPGHLLLEQYQAQLISAVRTALDASCGPILLEAGLQLATKIMISGILGGDQAAVKRIFSLISRPLNEFNDVYYPSFAEWVSCKIKIRLLAAHASLKCYTFAFLRRYQSGVPDEYLALLPLFSKSSSILGKYWIGVLKDYSYICLCLNLKKNWKPFLDGIQLPLVPGKLLCSLEEAWPVILQALALDAIPLHADGSPRSAVDLSRHSLISGYSMVELELEEYRFLWGFTLLVLFQQQHPTINRQIIPLSSAKCRNGGDLLEETSSTALKLYEIVLPVFQFLSSESFFTAKFLTADICQELLQVLSYSIYLDNSWNSLAISVLSQIVQNCPDDFLEEESFVYLAVELLLAYFFNVLQSTCVSDHPNWEDLASPLFITAKTILKRFEPKTKLKSAMLAFLLIGYKCIREASTELCFSIVNDFVRCISSLLKNFNDDSSEHGDDGSLYLRASFGACLNLISDLTKDCIKGIQFLENKRSDLRKLLQLKLAFSMEQIMSLAKLACQYLGETNPPICFEVFKCCIKYVHIILSDSNSQVQAIGLQVLKTTLQRSTDLEDTNFLLCFCGELVTDILTMIQTKLKKPVSKESVTIASECLRFLALLHTLSRSSECQKGLMHILLSTIIMVFLASEDNPSQEVNDLRSTGVRLVSHLAQVSSSAVCFKDVLLSMPATHRQQLQGVIRASVAQDHSATSTKTSPLEIKLPLPLPKDSKPLAVPPSLPVEETREKNSPLSEDSVSLDKDDEDQDDEDDWDAFQSFPASTEVAGKDLEVQSTAEEPELVENSVSEINNSQELSMSHPMNKDYMNVTEQQEADDPEEISGSPTEEGEIEIHHDQYPKSEDTVVLSQESESEVASSQENTRISSDLQSVGDAEESVKMNLVEDFEPQKRILADEYDQVLSDEPEGEPLEVSVTEDHPQKTDDVHSNNDIPEMLDSLPPENSDYERQCESDNNVNREKHVGTGDATSKEMDESENSDQHQESGFKLELSEGEERGEADGKSHGEQHPETD
ncbi:protein SWEETIE isoform X2 [Mercurialis annua]|uniref:protein SWEETIE isoform X2 n=1 Tax=Mercurialis annua TaxID=3986 RepID=UPI0021608D7A|nr:protein SWEETIE isoform X2 [Mercurialis annua]